jgi:anthranilate synthase component 1
VNADTSQAGAFDHATERLAELELRLAEPMPALSNVELGAIDTAEIESRVEFETQQSTFEAWVARIKDYILDGDVMQVVVSQRMTLPFTSDPINLYRALRHLNPSPYLFYLDLDEFHIVGSSPEILVRSERGQITVRPIAGTIRRGSDEEEDAMLAAALLNDEKERAEHLMLIDLGRNDVGRVAAPGSVELTDKMVIEKYSHVMHIVSNVTGSSRNGVTAIDALRATLPAGTLSGAPKIRAMEIIDELEPVKRGVYGGAIGYLTWSGDMDTAIAIRTAVIKDGQLVVQAGAGVVADSVPASEWEETLNKARAVLRAAAMVEAC